LFLLYLRPLFDALQPAHPTLWAPSYIDDVALVTHSRTREDNACELEAATRTAFQWANDNAIAFDDNKSELLHFHCTQQDTTPDAINVQLPNGTVVKLRMQGGRKDVVRLIGILFDRKVHFTHHINAKLIAMSRSFNVLCSLVKHETGLSPSATRSLYRTCILSRSDFGAEIWWRGQKTFTQRLQTQQNAALHRILNAFRSTPTIALHNEATLPPISVRLQSKQRKYALHILSLPPSHPVVKPCPSSFPIPNYLSTALQDPNEYDFDWSQPCHPPSRLVQVLCTLSPWVLPHADIEDMAQPTAAPWTTPTVRIDIPELPKDEAAIEYLSLLCCLRRNPRNVVTYTDGSQLTSDTGAGYYIPHGLPHPMRAIIPMGTTSEVFDAELKAISECLTSCHKYILQYRLWYCLIHLFTDNQSTILHASKSDRGPSQETTLDILHTIGDLLDRAIPVTLHWVPGHTDIAGNEEADYLAKIATSQSPFANIPISLSWLRRQVNEQHTTNWIEWYYAEPKPKTYDTPHHRCLDSAYTTLPGKQSAAILGLCTGHGYFLDCLAHPPSDNYPWLRWRRQSGDKYNPGAQFVNNY
jgi:ribonuclease HI